jgi:hypothetical protein
MGPIVRLELTYDDALRLAYMAAWPKEHRPGDDRISTIVTAAVNRAEEKYELFARQDTEF